MVGRLSTDRARAPHPAARLPGASLGGAGADPLFRLPHAPLFPDDALEGDELLSRRREAEQGNAVAGRDRAGLDGLNRGFRQPEETHTLGDPNPVLADP